MPQIAFLKAFRFRRNATEQRRWLQTSVIEGIPATIIGNILGGPILTAFLLYLKAGSTAVGLVLAIQSLANIVQVFAAFFMQRMENRKFWMALSGILHRMFWVLTGLIPVLLPVPARVPAFVALFACSFISAAVSGVVWSSLMSDMVPAQVRGRYFGVRNTVHWAFASIALLLSGQILESAGSPGAGFAILYLTAAICTVWNGIMLLRYPNLPFEKSQETSGVGRLLKPVRDRAFMTATGFIALFILIQNAAVPLFSYVMLDILGVSYTAVTVVTTVQMIVMMISYYAWGSLNARYPAFKLLLCSLPFIALACLLWAGLAFLPVLAVLVLVHVALGIGQGGYNLLNFTFLIGDTPKADRPMYIAVFAAATGLMGFVGPLIGGILYDAIADGPAWMGQYGVSMFTGLIMMALTGAGPFILSASRRSR
ncbi:MAG: MFS transporter [Thermobacillus sp.]|uniref:MFS transporter n=1 Tax=Thermobacillus sp. TaxID=2108467 RepID=UPI000E3ADFF0|nr:MFS transporter [Thermobacillus sp.]REK56128.1 MAG: MFS transporter [Thermobacillus sp.]